MVRLSGSRYGTREFLDVVTCGMSSPKRRGAHLFVILVADIDDSGSQGQGPVFVLAGYVASTNEWKRFADQWQMALDLRPKLTVFKLQQALQGEELWGRSKQTDRENRMKRFASIIHKHVQFGVSVSSSWDDLRRIQDEFFPKDELERQHWKYNPYFILFNALMANLVHHLKRTRVDSQIDFVFDEQGALGKLAVEVFDRIVDTLPPELTKYIAGRPIHRDDERVLPLQAAHTVAWLIRRYAEENNLTGDLSGWRPKERFLAKLTPGKYIPMLYSWYPYERLAEFFNQAKAELARSAKA